MDLYALNNLKGQMQEAANSVKSSMQDATDSLRKPLDEAQQALKDASASVETLVDTAKAESGQAPAPAADAAKLSGDEAASSLPLPGFTETETSKTKSGTPT